MRRNATGLGITGTAAAGLLLLAACGSSSTATPASTSAPASVGTAASAGASAMSTTSTMSSAMATATAGGKSHSIVFIQGVAGDGFYITMQCGIQSEAAKLGATVKTQGPAMFDPTLQTPILQAVVASHPDAILIAPTDVSAMQEPIAQAKAAGIKVVLVDTTLKDPSVAASAISSDNLAGGAAAFAELAKLAPGGGEVMVLNTEPGVSTTDDRATGFNAAAKKESKYTALGTQYDNDSASKAAQIVTATLQAHPNLTGIFATNLFSAQGAATGIRQAGKQGKVKVVGFDADPSQVAALKAGTVQALIAQQPFQIGVDGVEQAIDALDGKPVTAKIGTSFSILTQANLDTAAGKAAIYATAC